MTSPPTLPVLPYTRVEWKRAISEVKRKYLSRKYRSCSARCCEILDNLKDTANVEPLHRVYLHFYAASSFEMCARPLSQSSDYRTKMLRDAREHYHQATMLIQRIEAATSEKTRSASANSTTSSTMSLHSPSMSVSSDAPTMSTSLSSPRNSISSIEDVSTKQQAPKKKKKKVSFSGLPEQIEVHKPWEQPQDPYIRPDSPTLGWEEDHFLFGHQESYMAEPTMPSPMAKIDEREVVEIPKARPTSMDLPPQTPVDEAFNLESFLQNKTLGRFCSQLTALKDQVAWHRDAIDSLLAQPFDDVPETPSLPEVDHVPTSPRVPGSPALARLPSLTPDHETSSSSPGLYPPVFSPTSPLTPHSAQVSPYTLEHALNERLKESFGSANSFDLSVNPDHQHQQFMPRVGSRSGSFSSTRPPSVASTVRSMSSSTDEPLRDRIERLRAKGWQRKRFDSRRYEALREQVLGELGER